MSTKFLSPGWRMPRNANQSKSSNYSLNFNGGLQRVTASNFSGLANKNSGSFSLWFKTTNTTSNAGKCIFSIPYSSSGNGFDVYINNSTSLVSYLRTTTFTTTTTSTITYGDGNWHHVAVVYDGSTHKIYFDTVDVTNTSAATPSGAIAASTVNTVEIARFSSNYANEFNGQIYGVSIFDYALSSSQVTTLYGTGSAIGNPMALARTPIAYYPLDTSAYNGEYLAENNAIGDYVFDNLATNSRILTPISVSDLTNCTQAVWFKTSTNAQLNKFLFFCGPYSTFSISLQGTDTVRGDIVVNPATSGASPSVTFSYADGKWHHYILNFDGSNVSMYIDGVLVARQARSGTLRNGTTFTTIGNVSNTNSSSGATGEYSNFIAYEHTLTDGGVSVGDTATGEIATLYNYGSPIRDLSSIPQSSNLKAWYKLDASEIYNSSSTEWEVNDATATYNSSSFVIPIPNQNTQQIQVNNFDGLTGASAGSWSFWYNTQDFNNLTINGGWFNGGQARWIGPYGTPHTGYTNTGEFNIHTSDGTQRTSLAASYGRRIYIDAPAGGQLDKWAHFVGTYDGSNLRVYINGEQVGTGTGVTEFAATGTLTTNSIRFGGAYSYNSAYDAKFSNGSVWNKTLTLAEIVEIYNNGRPKSLSSHSAVSNLVSWWKLDNLTTGLVDSIGGYNATLVGSNSDVSSGSVSVFNGESSVMSQSNLVQSDLQTVAPYSKYAMNFDAGNADYIDLTSQIVLTSELTISCWVKSDGAIVYGIVAGDNGFADSWYRFYPAASGGNRVDIMIDGTSTEWNFANGGTPIQNGVWQHYLLKRDSNNKWTFYLDNVKYTTNQPTISGSFRVDTFCRIYSSAPRYFEGAMSNMAIWNTSLSDSQVREVYNQGLPSDLNSFSGTAPIHWWQLGEGSSYAGGWIFEDEIGSINGEGQNIAETDLTNGVGTTANGTSTGMSEGSLVGDAPYSTNNSMSVNMSSTAKGSNVP